MIVLCNGRKVPNLIKKINKALGLPKNSEFLWDIQSIANNTNNIANLEDRVDQLDECCNCKQGNETDIRDDCLNITSGHLARIYQEWGDVYSIEFEIVVNEMTTVDPVKNIFQFAVGGYDVSLIPALYIRMNVPRLHVHTSLSGNQNWYRYIYLELGKPYQIAIKQVKDGSQHWFEIMVNGETIVKEEQLDPFRYSNVYLYESNPSFTPFTAEFGSICNVTISGGVSSDVSSAITTI